MNWIRLLWQNLPKLIFPSTCAGCGEVLYQQEKMICLTCQFHLPFTDHLGNRNNELIQQLKGKFAFEYAAAFLTLQSSGRVERMLYQLKYNNQPAIGLYLGNLFAQHMLIEKQFQNCDYLVPIPLHTRRRLKRGYNQSERIAEGMSEVLKTPVLHHFLIRSSHNPSQTHLSRIERLENVKDIFECQNLPHMEGKHFLLVDDVLTTGATIVTAAERILEVIPKAKISICAIARA